MALLEDRTGFQLAFSFLVPLAFAVLVTLRLRRRADRSRLARALLVPLPVASFCILTWSLLVACGPYLPGDRPPVFYTALMIAVAWFTLVNLFTVPRLTKLQRERATLLTRHTVKTESDILAMSTEFVRLQETQKAELRARAPHDHTAALDLVDLIKEQLSAAESWRREVTSKGLGADKPGYLEAVEQMDHDVQRLRVELAESEAWLRVNGRGHR